MTGALAGRNRSSASLLAVDDLDGVAFCPWPEPRFDVRPGGAVIGALTGGESPQAWERHTLGRTWAVYRGTTDRFPGMWSWDVLNDALRSHRAWPQRLRVVHDGENLPLSSFSEPVPGAPDRNPRLRINGAGLRRPLLRGGTLVFGAVNEVLPAAEEIRSRLELAFHADVTANLYAAWGSDDAFGLHKDRSDSWALQLAGRKRWLIAEPGRPEPTAVTVEAGEAIYVPQGWGHCVRAMGGETVHITFGVHHPTGREVAEWLLLRQVARAENAGAVLHGPDSAPSRVDPAAAPRHSYWADRNARAPALPFVDLPPRRLDPGRPGSYRSNLAREARPCAVPDHVCLRAAGKRWVFDPSARSLLDGLFAPGAEGWPVLRLGGSATRNDGEVLATLYENGLVRCAS